MEHGVYLDNNASTPAHPEVREAMLPFLGALCGNPSSAHRAGRAARAAVEEAREQVAALIGADPREIIFTSGGSEADNLALTGTLRALPPAGKRGVAVCAVEHPAVFNTAKALEKAGYPMKTIGVDGQGVAMVDDAARALAEGDVALVSVMHANNETGVIQPVGEIFRLAREKGALTHTDAVQSAGKIPVDVKELGADLLSLSAHKLYGPKGVGALYIRTGVNVEPLLTGGSHERGLRAGTLNVPGIAGFGVACRLARERLEDESRHTAALRDRFQAGILNTIPGARINGHPEQRLPGTLNVSFVGADGEALFILLDMEGIYVSTGAACSSGATAPSPALTAMGLRPEAVRGSIRFSFGHYNTSADVDRVMAVLPGFVERARRKN